LTETSAPVPALIAARGPHAGRRFVEFFTANIRNPNTRRAYYRATSEFYRLRRPARSGRAALAAEVVRVQSQLWVPEWD
jgi:hypothetical protein